MVDFASLPPAEQTRQLGKPEGDVGIDVGLRMNSKITESVYTRLRLAACMDVLEIGFGNGRLLPDLMRYAEGLQYVNIDILPTMVNEARHFNAPLVVTGQAAFHLAGAEGIPSDAASFDRVFAVNVICFWANPHRPLQEIRRVLRPGGFSVIAAVTPETAAAAPILRPEFGFHVRDDATLVALHNDAGFACVTVEPYDEIVSGPDGKPWPGSYDLVVAQRA